MTTNPDPSAALLLAGCGRMGGALLEGWLDGGHRPDRIHVVEPDAGAAGRHGRPGSPSGPGSPGGPSFHAEPASVPPDFDPAVVIFAVKPQAMDAVAPSYRSYAGPRPDTGPNTGPGTVFLSIAAGKTIAYFESHLGAGAAIVRSMPNTPAAVGEGISVACANPHVGAEQRALCDGLLAAVGEVAWVEDEALLDPVTAVSGSGPAYVFLLVECLADAGVEAGLPADLAMQLARRTVIGAGALMRATADDAATLRQNVTSPAGTTQAALDELMAGDGLAPLMRRAVAAAARRSRELAD